MKKSLYLIFFLISLFLNNTILAWSEYKVGDVVPIDGIDFYIIKNSSSKDDTVTLLKKESLSYEEVQEYSENLDVQITNQNGYGAIPYYISNNCGFLNGPPSFD